MNDMSNSRAAQILREFRDFFTAHAADEIGLAIDKAIAVLSPDVEVTIDGIADVVCVETGVSRDELYGLDRCREYSEARWIVWILAKKYLGSSTTSLARHFNRKRHAKVVHGQHKGTEYLNNPILNPEWVTLFNQVDTKIRDGQRKQEI